MSNEQHKNHFLQSEIIKKKKKKKREIFQFLDYREIFSIEKSSGGGCEIRSVTLNLTVHQVASSRFQLNLTLGSLPRSR